MEDIVREYLKNNRQEMKKLKNENTKEKKHLTYNEIKKVIESGKDIKNNENKPIENKPRNKGKKTKNTFKQYNFDITWLSRSDIKKIYIEYIQVWKHWTSQMFSMKMSFGID